MTEPTHDMRLIQQVHQQSADVTDEHIHAEAPGDLDVLPRRGRREKAFGDLPEFFAEWEADGVVPRPSKISCHFFRVPDAPGRTVSGFVTTPAVLVLLSVQILDGL